MKNKILIMHVAVGPTYKERLLKNLTFEDGYDLYDVLILTDDVRFFESIKDKSNFFIKDIDDFRKNYPWSIEHEKLPSEKTDEIKYGLERVAGLRFPTLLDRFAFDWDQADQYEGFISMSCDVIPLKNVEEFKVAEKYFVEKLEKHPMFFTDLDLRGKTIVIPGGAIYDFHHSHLLEYAKEINEEYKITDKEISGEFLSNDGNFRTFNFPNKEARKKFFTLMNNIIHDVYVKHKYYCLGDHGHWRCHSEYIIAVVLNLMNGMAFPRTYNVGLTESLFKTECYPEDRFWSWGWECDLEKGKKGFIEKNYEKLKEFYANRGQKFPY